MPQGKGPLAEIEFWRERNASLGSLYEQLNTPQAKKVVATLEAGSGDANLLMRFKAQVSAGQRREAGCGAHGLLGQAR